MASSTPGGSAENSPKRPEEVGMEEELVPDLHTSGGGGEFAPYERREPTEEDIERYKAYVGQKWSGKCKWFNVTKLYGFIVPDVEEAKQHADDVFVHQSELQMPGFRSLDEGEEVEFTVRLGKRGLEAADVCGIGGIALRGHRIHPLGKRKEKEIRCYNCGKYGLHKASHCKRMPQKNVKACYVCHSMAHLASDCPNKEQQQQQHQKNALKAAKSDTKKAIVVIRERALSSEPYPDQNLARSGMPKMAYNLVRMLC
uniref:CSD domain-containing protein n=1 Tax=Globodera rostochiensis TaxID=31243 RepID=A0A914IC58_GLORO